jgi:hypothetical protein
MHVIYFKYGREHTNVWTQKRENNIKMEVKEAGF